MTNNFPTESWSLEQLGQFAQQVAKRTAHDAWLLGRAYVLAKAKAKAEGKKLEQWRKEWLPFMSQPTLSRYEAVSKLAEEDVKGKGLAEVYRLLGIASEKTRAVPAHSPSNDDLVDVSPPKTSPTEVFQTKEPSQVIREAAAASEQKTGPLQRGATLKVVSAVPEVEPDSVLKRMASVVALLSGIVRDLPSLDASLDATSAINDAVALLEQVRRGLGNTQAA